VPPTTVAVRDDNEVIMRNVVETSRLTPENMAVIASGRIGYYQIKKLLSLAESICPDICPVTPPSTFKSSGR
jgi:hypothetical protein